MPENETNSDVATLTVQLLSAYLTNNTVASDDLAELIRTTRVALMEDANSAAESIAAEAFTPAVSVRKSLASSAHIISLIDGKPYRTLKRHLASHGLTPDTYRSRYGLPASYPMVAPDYAAHRRDIAQKMGLGNRSSGSTAPSSSDAPISSLAPTDEQGSIASQSETPVAAAAKATRRRSKK